MLSFPAGSRGRKWQKIRHFSKVLAIKHDILVFPSAYSHGNLISLLIVIF
ncbi:MAG: hypothetical protein LBR79_05020 [Oscillospiraceae bacterium]|nr:hypothetical protein [Oscillospiraceae bacterium]